MPSLLKQLGISSPQEAAELERDLGIRFNDLTLDQRETWKRQTVYLGLYAETGAYSYAAHGAGITVRTVRTWQAENTLGFNDRLELAVLEYSEAIDLIILQHVRKPDCSPSLLMMFARAQFPGKYGPIRRDTAPRSTNRCDHQCDHDPQPAPTSRYDLQFLEEIFQDLQNLKHFAGLSNPDLTPPSPSPVLGESRGEGPALGTQNSNLSTAEEEQTDHPNLSTAEEEQTDHPDLSPTGDENPSHPDLSPTGGETQRGGIPTPTDHAPTTPSPVLGEGWGEGESPAPNTQNPEPPLNRRQRRELQRRAKRQKSHLARAPD